MHRYSVTTLLLGLLAFFVLLGAGYFLLLPFFSLPTPPRPPVQQITVPPNFPADAPAPTPKDYVAAQTGFQYLVSYNATGFHPTSLIVKKGETVRFTNNSSGIVQFSLGATQSSALVHGQYWQYTFSTSGNFIYSDGTAKGTVTVK
jgi:plastocyanin